MSLLLALAVSAAQLPAGVVAGEREVTPPRIDLVTFGPGDLIFERWGHAALCLDYHAPDLPDVCFNYGNTEFDRPVALAWNFLRGDQEFWVSVMTRDTMLEWYAGSDRDIYSQLLPLAPAQARRVEREVWRDLEPQHVLYVYDHLTDNCSTRVRDLVDGALGGLLRASASLPFPLTYRELGLRGLGAHPVLSAASDFLVGRSFDAPPTIWQAMFHPDVMRDHVALVLTAPADKLHARSAPPPPTSAVAGRIAALAIAAALALLLVFTRLGRGALWLTSLYLGLWGAVIYTLVLVSPVEALRINEVAFVLVPLDLALPAMSPGRRRFYARLRVVGLVTAAVLSAAGVLWQPLWIPIATALLPHLALAFARSDDL